MIINFCQLTFGWPADLLLFSIFEPLEFFDDIYLKFRANPHCKLKCYIFVCIRPAIPTGFCVKTDGVGSLNKFSYTDFEAIQTGLISNCGEFAIIKSWIINLFPNTNIFKRIPVSQPVSNKKVSVLCFKHIGKADIVFFFYLDNAYFCFQNSYLSHFSPALPIK